MNKAISFLTLFICFNCVVYSQESEFFDGNEVLKQLFSNVKMNSSGSLCVTMKNENKGGKYLTFIDDNKEPIISVYNEVYCVKDSIKFFEKHSGIILKKMNSNYWSISYKFRNPYAVAEKKMEGGFELKNNIIKSLKKEEYELLKKDEN